MGLSSFRTNRIATVTMMGFIGMTFAACEGGAAGQAGGSGTPGETAPVGDTCKSNDPEFICLATRYVAYKREDGTSVSTPQQAADSMRQINRVWEQCRIGFQIDQYEEVDPREIGLASGAGAVGQLDTIRKKFASPNMLVQVYTHEWGTTKNAWTKLPGSEPYGAVYEASVADYPNIAAHELGHYLNLDHISDSSNVMSALIYTSSTGLSEAQCQEARQAATQYWGAMRR